MDATIGDEFNILLAGELSALETYDLAMRRKFDQRTEDDLIGCRASHEERVGQLRQCVIDNGVEPSNSAGPFGAINSIIENSASNAKEALQLLEELEAERLVQYEAQRKIVSPTVLPVLENYLLPAQHNTHLVISSRIRTFPDLPEVA